MSEWAVWQYFPGLPAEGDDSPGIPEEPPAIVARGFASEEEAEDAIDGRFGDLFNVGTAPGGGRTEGAS